MKKLILLLITGITAAVSFAGTNDTPSVFQGQDVPGSSQKIAVVNSNDSVIFDFSKTVITGSDVALPVSIFTDDTIYALDFSFKFNHMNVTYDSVVNNTSYIQPLAYYNAVDSTFRFTSFGLQPYAHGVSLVDVHFTMLGTQMVSSDLNTISTFLNGDPCSVSLIGAAPSGVEELMFDKQVSVYPNPVRSGELNVNAPAKSMIQVLAPDGREVRRIQSNPGQNNLLNTANLATGLYLVRVSNEHAVSTRRIIIMN